MGELSNYSSSFGNIGATAILEQLALKFDKSGGTIDGNLIVTGDTTIQGTQFVLNSLSIDNNFITLNEGLSGIPAPETLVSGIKINRGTDAPYYFVFRESDDTFAIGVSGGLQAVATRADSPTDNALQYWDDASKSFLSSGILDTGTAITTPYKLGVATSTFGTLSKLMVNPAVTVDNAACAQLTSCSDAGKAMVIQRFSATQTAALTEWQKSDGAILIQIDKDGNLSFPAANHGSTDQIVKFGTGVTAGYLRNDGAVTGSAFAIATGQSPYLRSTFFNAGKDFSIGFTSTISGISNTDDADTKLKRSATGGLLISTVAIPAAVVTTVKGVSGQTGNLQNYSDSNDTVLSSVSSVGQFIAPQGSSSAPSFTFLGDLDTGFYQGGTGNTIYVLAGGTNAASFSSTGLSVQSGKAFSTGGSVTRAIKIIETAGTTTAGLVSDNLVVFTGTNTQTYTLFTCASGKELIFKNKSTGAVTLNRGGTDTIETGTSAIVLAAGDAVTLMGHLSDWMVIV